MEASTCDGLEEAVKEDRGPKTGGSSARLWALSMLAGVMLVRGLT